MQWGQINEDDIMMFGIIILCLLVFVSICGNCF